MVRARKNWVVRHFLDIVDYLSYHRVPHTSCLAQFLRFPLIYLEVYLQATIVLGGGGVAFEHVFAHSYLLVQIQCEWHFSRTLDQVLPLDLSAHPLIVVLFIRDRVVFFSLLTFATYIFFLGIHISNYKFDPNQKL